MEVGSDPSNKTSNPMDSKADLWGLQWSILETIPILFMQFNTDRTLTADRDKHNRWGQMGGVVLRHPVHPTRHTMRSRSRLDHVMLAPGYQVQVRVEFVFEFLPRHGADGSGAGGLDHPLEVVWHL